MSERFSRNNSAVTSGRGTAPPKRAPTPQRRHTLSTVAEIPPLPPRRLLPGNLVDSDSDSGERTPRVRVMLPPTSGRGRPASAAPNGVGSLPVSRHTTPLRGASPARFLDGSPKPLIIKTMPFSRTNSQPAFAEATAPTRVPDRRSNGGADTQDAFAGTYSSGMLPTNAHPPLVPHSPLPAGLMPPLAPTNHTVTTRTESAEAHMATPDFVVTPKLVSPPEAPQYPTEEPLSTATTATTSHASSPTSVAVQPEAAAPSSSPCSPGSFAAAAAAAAAPAAVDSTPHIAVPPPAVPPLYVRSSRAASPPLMRAKPPTPGMQVSPRSGHPAEAATSAAAVPDASASAATAPRAARVPSASAAAMPRGPPPLAPRTAVDDGWSGFSPRPELPGRRAPPMAGSARGVPREKPANASRPYTQSSRRPTQSVQTARERAAQRRRAASSSPMPRRAAGATPLPGDRDSNMFPGAKRVEANDRVTFKHAALLVAGAITTVVTAVLLVRAIVRTPSAPDTVVPITAETPSAVSAPDAVAAPSRRDTLPVMLGPPVGARKVSVRVPQPAAAVHLSSTGEDANEVMADIRERVIDALSR